MAQGVVESYDNHSPTAACV